MRPQNCGLEIEGENPSPASELHLFGQGSWRWASGACSNQIRNRGAASQQEGSKPLRKTSPREPRVGAARAAAEGGQRGPPTPAVEPALHRRKPFCRKTHHLKACSYKTCSSKWCGKLLPGCEMGTEAGVGREGETQRTLWPHPLTAVTHFLGPEGEVTRDLSAPLRAAQHTPMETITLGFIRL